MGPYGNGFAPEDLQKATIVSADLQRATVVGEGGGAYPVDGRKMAPPLVSSLNAVFLDVHIIR